jgi:predicted dehydrogenase
VVVVGLGGYGLVHIEAVRWLASQNLARLAGVVALEVDRKARPDLVSALKDERVTLHDSVEDFFASGHTADMLTVPVGIDAHVPLSVRALRAGLDVYCEKPVAATVQEVDRLLDVQEETGRTVAVGYQHLWSHSIQQIKARILDGRLGPVRRATLLCGWPRSKRYYTRNEWTGKLRHHDRWILDSPANNAHAHYVMNVLYLCGGGANGTAVPTKVRAGLFRANPIEGPDTVQLEMETDTGVRVHCCLTHANAVPSGPSLRLECEKGRVYWDTDEGRTIVRYARGGTEMFDNQTHERWRFDGFKDLVLALREKRSPLCTPLLARAQTLAINAMHEACPAVRHIPEEDVQIVEDWEMFPPKTPGEFHRVRNLDEYLRVAVEENATLAELGVPWAKGEPYDWFSVGEYRHFPTSRGSAGGPREA